MCHAIVIDFHRFVLPTRRTMGGFAQFMGGSPQGDGNRPGHQAGLGATGGRLWMDWLWMDECSSIFSKRRPEVLGILVVFSILASSGDCQSVLCWQVVEGRNVHSLGPMAHLRSRPSAGGRQKPEERSRLQQDRSLLGPQLR
jgi:hypothetical protein